MELPVAGQRAEAQDLRSSSKMDMKLRSCDFSSKSMILRVGLALVFLAKCTDGLKFGMIAAGSSFFEPIIDGFKAQCQVLGADCSDYITPDNCGPSETLDKLLANWTSQGVKGIAVKSCNDMFLDLLNRTMDQGVYITTFDSDFTIPTRRTAYVGTDNVFLGRTMAKLVRQLRPEGGTFVFVGRKLERDDGFISEITRYNNRDDKSHWFELEGPTEQFLLPDPLFTDPYNNPPDDNYLLLMERAAVLNPTVMLFLKQTPMKSENYSAFVDKNRYRNITYIGVDGADYQLAYLNTRYVDGLVGQLTYEIGVESVNMLYDLVQSNGTGDKYKKEVEEQKLVTNIVAYNIIPSRPPALNVDENLIGNLKYMGYCCFGIVTVSVIACVVWTWRLRACFIVRTSQPHFLYMVAAGAFIMAGSMIPLTFDDGGSMAPLNRTKRVAICMSVPWLALIGFTVIFSGLAAKLWRVNRLFHARVQHARIQVTERDVLTPVVILLASNIIILTLWTVLDPLMYTRRAKIGVDYWNRIISTYGTCRCQHVVAYLVPLAAIDCCAVVFACWQAMEARHISSEFSEAKYVGLAMGVLLQAFLTGFPVLFMVREEPIAYYIILTMLMFVLSEGILLLIFVPKIFMQRKYGWMSEEQQIRALKQLVRKGGKDGDWRKNAGGSFDASSSAFKPDSEDRCANSSEFTQEQAQKIGRQDPSRSGVSNLLASAEEIILDEIVEEDEVGDGEPGGEMRGKALYSADESAPEEHSQEENEVVPAPVAYVVVRTDQTPPSEITQEKFEKEGHEDTRCPGVSEEMSPVEEITADETAVTSEVTRGTSEIRSGTSTTDSISHPNGSTMDVPQPTQANDGRLSRSDLTEQ